MCAGVSLKSRAVALNCGSGIVFREAEVQRMSAIGCGESPFPGGKRVDEPRDMGQGGEGEDRRSRSLAD